MTFRIVFRGENVCFQCIDAIKSIIIVSERIINYDYRLFQWIFQAETSHIWTKIQNNEHIRWLWLNFQSLQHSMM